ncbi:MAG: choice-of-anchor D domain-containing protein [bacterium]
MKKALCLFTFLLILSGLNNANSQSLSVFNIDDSAFPKVKANYVLVGTDGNQITNSSAGDFTVTENEIPRLVTNVTCPSSKEPQALSSVLVIDISKSMSPDGIIIAKAAANAWIEMLPLGKSECAITGFSTGSYLIQDFTTNKQKLEDGINRLFIVGGTDYDQAMYYPPAGGVIIAKTGIHKRIIVFLSDGGPTNEPNTAGIIQVANKNNISIYCVTIGMPAPQCMKDFAIQTGGFYFDNIKTKEEAEDCYRRILTMAQESFPCEIEWESEANCSIKALDLSVTIPSMNLSSKSNYIPSNKSLAKLNITPPSIQFFNFVPGVKSDTTITVTAINSDFNVTNITSSDPAFTITPSNFFLKNGQKQDLTVSLFSTDSTYKFTKFDFVNDKCLKNYYAIAGFTAKKPNIPTIKLTHPNGGELFVIGSDTVITWEGILPTNRVKLEYSIDNGTNWTFITDSASNFKYIWKNIPPPASNNCLVKVIQLADTAKTYKPGTLITTLESRIDTKYLYSSPFVEAKWSPDSKLCAISNPNNSVSICEVVNGKELHQLTGHKDKIKNICWSPNGNFIATASRDSKVKIWESSKGTIFLTLGTPSLTLYDVNWSPDGTSLATPCSDETTIIWDALSGSKIDILIGHTKSVKSAMWSPDGQYSATCDGSTAKIWDMKTGTEVYTFSDTTILGSIGSVTWSPKGNFLSTSTIICGFAVWDALTKKNINLLYGDGAWSPDETRAAIIRPMNKTIIYDIRTAKEIQILDDCSRPSWNSDGTKLATIGMDNTAIIWDAITGRKLYTLTGHNQYLYKINWSPDGTRVATTSADSTVKIWFIGNLPMEVQSDQSDEVFSIVAPQAKATDIDMKKCLVGIPKDSLITDFIRNIGSYKFSVDSIYFSGADANAFSLASGFPKYEIAQGASKSTVINFAPNRVGIHNATINIITQADTLIQKIQGEGVEQQLEIISKLLDFGIVNIGNEKTIQDTALITNISGYPIEISNVVQLGPDKKQFEIISGGGAFTLQPNESRKLSIGFKPVLVGRTSGQVGFEYSGVGSPAIVQLFGAGIGPLLVSIKNDSAYAGEEKALILLLNNGNLENIALTAPNFDARIRFQKTLLTPIDKQNRNIVNDSVYINIKGSFGTSQELAQIPVMAGLGNVEETTIDIVDFVLSDNLGNVVNYDIETTSGKFKLLGICREGGTRLILPTGKVEILAIIPNPASDDVYINLNLIEDCFTTLSVFNSNGIKLKEYNLTGATGLQTINIDARGFDNGLYFIQLQTPTVVTNQKLMIIK